MKIVFVLPGIERSGGVKCTVDLANELIGRGHRVRLLHRKERRNFASAARSLFTGLIYADSASWTREFKGDIESFPELHAGLVAPDEIVIAVGMWASAELGKLSSAPNLQLQYIHGATPWDPDLMRRALSLPSPKIVVASYLKPIVESYGGLVVGVIGNGFDPAQYHPSVDESQRDGIGFVYGAHEAKAPETIFEIVGQLQRRGVGIPIRGFGIERKPRQLRNCRYWRYPSIDLARDIYSRSIIWIVGSRSEGFSLPILEAMACGCVVVATDCGGPRDIIRDGENGFLVPVGDVDQILDRVQLLIDDEAMRTRFRYKSIETVRTFTWEASAKKIEQSVSAVSQPDSCGSVGTRWR